MYITAPCVVPVIQQGHVNITRANNSTPYMPKTDGPILARHGDKLSIKCNGKYEPAGGNIDLATCNNGTWTYIPKCEPGKAYNHIIIIFLFYFLVSKDAKSPDLITYIVNR